MITVKETEDLDLFIKIQTLMYKGDKLFVPPLIKEEKKLLDDKKNPFYKNASRKLFIAYDNGAFVGRIAAIINRNHNKKYNDKIGFFGFFESVDDYRVSNKLFQAAEDYLLKNGMNVIRGPVNPSMNDTCGFLCKGFYQEPVFMMPYNRRYYLELAEKYGFKKDKDLLAFYLSTANKPKKYLTKLADYVKKKHGITLRNFSKKQFNSDIEIIREIYNRAWNDNWGFVPVEKEEFEFGTQDFKTIIPEELVIIAEKDSKPCGFSAIIPDFNQVLKYANGKITPFNALQLLYKMKKIDNYRLITLGVLPECRHMGVDLLLYISSFDIVEKRNGRGGELSWILEDNEDIIKPTVSKINIEYYKTYRIYSKKIGTKESYN